MISQSDWWTIGGIDWYVLSSWRYRQVCTVQLAVVVADVPVQDDATILHSTTWIRGSRVMEMEDGVRVMEDW